MAKKPKEKNVKQSTKDNSLFDLDNEIVIGIKTLPKPTVPKKKNTKQKSKKISKDKYSKEIKNHQKKSKKKKKNKKITAKEEAILKKRKKVFRGIKWTTLLILLIGGGIYFLLSPFFNIKTINVIGNEKIATDEIISLSSIQLEQNLFKVRKNIVIENIKQNSYIDTVQVKYKLPNEVEVTITERTPTFMISFANAYVYINNQGYLLEVSKDKIDTPILTGFKTKEEDIQAGSRLCLEDLQRLDDVLQILKSAESNELNKLITKINIADKQNYILELKEEKKMVHLGDISNLSTKMLYVKSIIEQNKDIEGDIFVNTDLSTKGAIFRKKI